MKYIVISKPKFPVPPEVGLALMDAFSAFINKYTANGKVEQSWSFAGHAAGGAIINVDSLEELDAVMQEYPLGAFSEIEIHGLVDLQESIQRGKQVLQAMAAAMGQ